MYVTKFNEKFLELITIIYVQNIKMAISIFNVEGIFFAIFLIFLQNIFERNLTKGTKFLGPNTRQVKMEKGQKKNSEKGRITKAIM